MSPNLIRLVSLYKEEIRTQTCPEGRPCDTAFLGDDRPQKKPTLPMLQDCESRLLSVKPLASGVSFRQAELTEGEETSRHGPHRVAS